MQMGNVDEKRPENPLVADAAVVVKIAVFARDDRVYQPFRDIAVRHDFALLLEELAYDLIVSVVNTGRDIHNLRIQVDIAVAVTVAFTQLFRVIDQAFVFKKFVKRLFAVAVPAQIHKASIHREKHYYGYRYVNEHRLFMGKNPFNYVLYHADSSDL